MVCGPAEPFSYPKVGLSGQPLAKTALKSDATEHDYDCD